MRSKGECAAVVSIGDELVIGQSLDTNSMWLSRRLTEAGFAVAEHATAPDDLNAIAATLRRLCASCGVVIISGGLGPTADDLTREAIAAVMGERLIEDQQSLTQIEQW